MAACCLAAVPWLLWGQRAAGLGIGQLALWTVAAAQSCWGLGSAFCLGWGSSCLGRFWSCLFGRAYKGRLPCCWGALRVAD